MRNKTYHKMTRKRPFRRLRMFKQKYLTLPRLYSLLARLRLVEECSDFYSLPLHSKVLNKIEQSGETLTTDRGVFNISHLAKGTEYHDKLYYKSRFKGKILYTAFDKVSTEVSIMVHADCVSFVAHFNPFYCSRICMPTQVVHILGKERYATYKDGNTVIKPPEFKKHTCSLLNARLNIEVRSIVAIPCNMEATINSMLKEAVNKMKNYIEENSELLNERITGVKNDGEFVTKDGQRLMQNCLCQRCGSPLFKSSVDGYTAQCVVCDEDFYGIEIRKVDPVAYKRVYENCKETLADILNY